MTTADYALRVLVNGVDITEAVLSWKGYNGPDENTMTIESTMRILLNGKNPQLSLIDLKGTVFIDWIKGEHVVRQYSGCVVRGNTDGGNYVLECRDAQQILDEFKIGGGFGTGLLPVEKIYYILNSSMPQHTDKKSLHMSPSKTLADADWLFAPRKYVYIAPIPSCILTRSSVELGEAHLYRTNATGYVDDFNIAETLPGNTPPEWASGRTRLRIEIEAEGFLDAFEKGREKLRKILDFVSFGINLSTPQFTWNSQVVTHDFQRKRIFVNVQETA